MERARMLPDGIELIDLPIGAHRSMLAAYLVRGRETALIDTGPLTAFEALSYGLRRRGIHRGVLNHVIFTHTHIDHAGAARPISDLFPEATIWVHPSARRHLEDPTIRQQEAAMIHGRREAALLFGPMGPVPRHRIRALADGGSVDLGDRRLDVMFTPGHADDHISLVDSDSRAVVAGEALGIRFSEVGIVRPSMPPPEADVSRALHSISVIAARKPEVLLLSHFGPVPDAEAMCQAAAQELTRWSDVVREALSYRQPGEDDG